MEATLKGEFGNELVDCSAEASVGTKQTKHNANASMRIEQECLGGDSSIWLGATADNADEIQAKWADSVQPDNLYALDMHLHFAWEIVTALNPTLGGNYKKYLQEKWEKQKVNTNDLSHIALAYRSFKSVKHGAYMYTGKPNLDDKRRHVLCWLESQENPSNDPSMRWEIVQYDGYVGIRSLHHNEWLYAGTHKKEENKRYPLVWRGAGDPETDEDMRWTIEDFGAYSGIKSVRHGEWLYAGKPNYDASRKYCFTYGLEGTPATDPDMRWIIM